MKHSILLFSAALLLGMSLATPAHPQNAEAVMDRWWLMDADGDKKISEEEAQGQLKDNFGRVDADGDGFVVQSELDALSKRLLGGDARARRGANRQGNTPRMTDEALLERAPEGVTVLPNLAYREGNGAWKLDLAMPSARGDAPRPAIVFIHGGGWTGGDKRTANFINGMLDSAADGYVAVSVNYRLDATKRPCIEDVKCAVRWLRAHAEEYNLDPERIGAYGNSAGAHLAVMLGVCPASAGLEGDGPWQEFSSKVQAAAGSATPTRPRLRGGPEEEEKALQPMTYVSADVPPVLLFHEASDRTVDVANSDDFAKALREAGAKDVTYLRYEDGTGHGVFMKNIEKTGPARAEFFARTLRHKAATNADK